MDVVMREKLVAAFICIASAIYLYGALHLKMGSITNPGPGFLPLIAGVVLLASAFLNLFYTFKKEEPEDREQHPMLQPILITILIVAYISLFSEVGFLVGTTLMVFGILRIMKYKTWVASLVAALVITFVTYAAFAKLLGVVLPGGVIEEYLFFRGW